MALEVTHEAARKLVMRDTRLLAPGMEERVKDFSNRCATTGHPIFIYETARSHRLARMYFQLGSSKSPDGWRTWHFYFLACDVIHPTRFWSGWDDEEWATRVVEHGKASGLDWGGDWKSFQDKPHFQFDTLKPSPSDEAIRIYREEGITELWRVVGAL